MPVHIAVLSIDFLAGACSGVVGLRVGYSVSLYDAAGGVGWVMNPSLALGRPTSPLVDMW